MSLKPIELISFNLCPFVQRSVITLEKKGMPFKITYIDLANKPDWFLELSPLGKVPVVKYGNDVLFESAVINEFLDEITSPPLMPTEPMQKAKARGWIEYSSQVLMDQYMMSVANNHADFEKHSQALNSKLERLENTISEDGFFNGNRFSLVDSSLAPVFTRLEIIARRFNRDSIGHLPKITSMSKKLNNLDFVKRSVLPNFEDIYVAFLLNKKSYVTL
jgi:glutathione S-transferase